MCVDYFMLLCVYDKQSHSCRFTRSLYIYGAYILYCYKYLKEHYVFPYVCMLPSSFCSVEGKSRPRCLYTIILLLFGLGNETVHLYWVGVSVAKINFCEFYHERITVQYILAPGNDECMPYLVTIIIRGLAGIYFVQLHRCYIVAPENEP